MAETQKGDIGGKMGDTHGILGDIGDKKERQGGHMGTMCKDEQKTDT